MRRTLQRRAIPAGYKEKASALVRFDYAGRYFLLSHLKRFGRRVCKILLGPIMWSCYVLIMRSPEIGICKKRLRSNGNRDIILQPATQAPLWHFPVFLTCNVRNCLNALSYPQGSCSKLFGESTPPRSAYKAHSSPNSPKSSRLVKPPPLEGPARHIVHQTIWKNAIPAPLWPFRMDCVALFALFFPPWFS